SGAPSAAPSGAATATRSAPAATSAQATLAAHPPGRGAGSSRYSSQPTSPRVRKAIGLTTRDSYTKPGQALNRLAPPRFDCPEARSALDLVVGVDHVVFLRRLLAAARSLVVAVTVAAGLLPAAVRRARGGLLVHLLGHLVLHLRERLESLLDAVR